MTVTATTPTQCQRPDCGQPFPPRWSHGRWQRYCSASCAQQDRFGKRSAALAITGPNPKAWMLTRLNQGMPHHVMAALLGMQRQALYAWWRELGIRRVVRYE